MGDSLILEKHFNGSSFYDVACFTILASGPHSDATITQILFSDVSLLMLLY